MGEGYLWAIVKVTAELLGKAALEKAIATFKDPTALSEDEKDIVREFMSMAKDRRVLMLDYIDTGLDPCLFSLDEIRLHADHLSAKLHGAPTAQLVLSFVRDVIRGILDKWAPFKGKGITITYETDTFLVFLLDLAQIRLRLVTLMLCLDNMVIRNNWMGSATSILPPQRNV